jgi:hypothetical protein
LTIHVYADTEENALKIFEQRKQRWIAEGMWFYIGEGKK